MRKYNSNTINYEIIAIVFLWHAISFIYGLNEKMIP